MLLQSAADSLIFGVGVADWITWLSVCSASEQAVKSKIADTKVTSFLFKVNAIANPICSHKSTLQ